MKRILGVYLIAILLVLNANSVVADEEVYQLEWGYVEFQRQKIKLQVEVAANRIERGYGLMNRTGMLPGQGMLFVFQGEKVRRVWMKNVQFPLDIIFLTAEGKVVSMLHALQPCITDACDIFASEGAAKYMLETNAGFIDKNGIKTGDSVLFFL